MAIKSKRPVTPAQRGMTTTDLEMVTVKKPVKSLLGAKKQRSGRNNSGRITVRHRGGGVKRHYRQVSFGLPRGSKLTVEAIEYDPNRTARIARVRDEQGQLRYVIASQRSVVGQTVIVDDVTPIEPGNTLALRNIPLGSIIFNIELNPGKGGQIARSAGTGAQLVAKEGEYAQVKLPSGEVRRILLDCQATLGTVSNEQHQNVKLGSAGRRRRKGWRPSVRGLAMNAVDHAHGGGDGGAAYIGKDPRTPSGKKTLGYKTRRRKSTNKYIVRSRHQAKRK
jgi:large subunit ribosomal protein L2